MNGDIDIARLLQLRKLTRALSAQMEAELKDYMEILAPLFAPQAVFGDNIRGGPKTPVKGAEKAFRRLRDKFHAIARQPPFSLHDDLNPPVDLFTATPVLSPVEYVHDARGGNGETVAVTITSPLRWVVSYPDLSPAQIRRLLGDNRNQSRDSLRHALLQTLSLETLLELRPGLTRIFDGLRYRMAPAAVDGLSPLQMIHISCPISTRRPADAIIIQNTEISGIASFEEVIDLEQIGAITDPFRERVMEIVESETPELLPEIA